MRAKHIVLALMVLTLLQACSVIHKVFRMNQVSATQKQVIRRPIVRKVPTPQNFAVKIAEIGHTYVYETVNATHTQQFVITAMQVFAKPPERALRVKLKARKLLKPPLHKITKLMIEKAINKTFTVSFPFNSSFLPRREAGKLRHAIEVLKSGHARNIDIIGYNCWLGSRRYNQWLALRRARSAALRLKQAGLKIRSISGKGKCCYIDRKNPAPNRRVEITYSPSLIRPAKAGGSLTSLQGGLHAGRREGGDAL